MTLYEELRVAGKAMHAKVLAATQHLDFNPVRIAKRMTIPVVGRTILFDDESVQNAFLDFWFHEYRVNGKSLAQSVDPVAAGLTPLEAEVLEAARQAQTSLFKMEGVLPQEHQVRLRDVLESTRPELLLTDLGLSASLHRHSVHLVLFCRPVAVRSVTMTSGFNFGFLPERLPGLLEAYRQKMKKVPPEELPLQRFIFFFQKHRQIGLRETYQDVV
ncbi:MAG TPA: hypothetical protein VNZ22_10755 [Bacillota bacterium]|nr:hypothetical protein [Bacillota bacterium]